MNYLKSLDRRERLIAVAILNGVFIISLFFEWGAGGARAWDADSVWLAFLAALFAGLISLADAFDYEVPRLPGAGVSAYLTSVTLLYTVIALMDIRDQSWGIIVSLIVSIVSTFIAWGTWRADRA
ncbi:MAG: hypothetical protein KGQ95_01640 [Acidobacteria bacterium]|nr:hypothetical protein [Acidobacteriota bacterium]